MPGLLNEYKDQQENSLKGFFKSEKKKIADLQDSVLGQSGITNEEKGIFKDVINQITTAMSVGSKPKREDYITASKELAEISDALGRIAGDPETAGTFNPTLMNALNGTSAGSAINIALNFIKKKKPSLPGAAVTSMGDKMKSATGGFLKNIAMETFGGIPMGGAAVEWASEKISGFGKSMVQGKKLSETELGVGRAFGGGAGEDGEDGAGADDAEGNGGTSEVIKDVKEEILGGESTGGGGGGLGKTNEILTEIEEHLQWIRDNSDSAETKREMRRDKGKKKAGGAVVGKELEEGEDGGGGFFSNLIGTLLGHGGGMLAIKTFFKSGKGAGLWSKILPKVLTVGRFIPIIGAIIGPLVDGIFGWFKADEWQTSKAGAVVGAAIGGTGSGASGAAWGALKGGAVGFAVGGPLGALAGVLIGAIAGWFGGKRIAKALDAIGTFFSEKWNAFLGLFGKDDKAMTKRVKLKEMGEERMDLEKLLAEEQAKKGKSLKEVKEMATAGVSGNIQKGVARTQATAFNADKVAQLQAQISAAKGEEKRFMETGMEGSAAELRARGAALPALIEAAKTKKMAKGRVGDERLVKSLTEELNSLKVGGFAARGGVIINRPAYLPSSGVVVGEHSSYSGRGTPRDGGPEVLLGGAAAGAVIPLGADRASTFIDPVSRSIAGAVMNQMAMDKIGYERGRGSMYDQPPAIVDASTNTNVTNNTIVRSPSPRGQEMHFERSDFVHKIA